VGELDSWEYCDEEEDRRFYSEIKAGRLCFFLCGIDIVCDMLSE
jgi:hypothetical protein